MSGTMILQEGKVILRIQIGHTIGLRVKKTEQIKIHINSTSCLFLRSLLQQKKHLSELILAEILNKQCMKS